MIRATPARHVASTRGKPGARVRHGPIGSFGRDHLGGAETEKLPAQTIAREAESSGCAHGLDEIASGVVPCLQPIRVGAVTELRGTEIALLRAQELGVAGRGGRREEQRHHERDDGRSLHGHRMHATLAR